jgi:hypothetical protein
MSDKDKDELIATIILLVLLIGLWLFLAHWLQSILP